MNVLKLVFRGALLGFALFGVFAFVAPFVDRPTAVNTYTLLFNDSSEISIAATKVEFKAPCVLFYHGEQYVAVCEPFAFKKTGETKVSPEPAVNSNLSANE